MKKLLTIILASFIVSQLFGQNALNPAKVYHHQATKKTITNGLKRTVAPVNILYWADSNQGTDQMVSSFEDLPEGSSYTIASSDDNFEYLITTEEFDMAIFLVQGSGASNYDGAIRALHQFALNGGIAMYSDWSRTGTYATLFEFSFTGNRNQTEVIALPPLSYELEEDTFTLVNPGWGTFATGLSTSTGDTLAIFANGEGAILETMNGHAIIYGFTADAIQLPILFEETGYFISDHLFPKNAEICALGDPATFEAQMDSAVTFIWQLSMDDGASFIDLADDATYTGTTTDMLSVSASEEAMLEYVYRCIGYINDEDSIISRNAAITYDSTAPKWNFEDNYTLFTCGVDSGYVAIDVAPFDICGLDTFYVVSSYKTSPTDPSGFYPLGSTTVDYYARDIHGNELNDYFVVTLEYDTELPTWNIDTLYAACGDSAYIEFPEAMDNCGIDTVIFDSPYGMSSTNPDGNYPIGTTTITYEIEDNFSNSISGTIDIHVVVDTFPPVISCPNDTLIAIWQSNYTISGTAFDVIASDDCEFTIVNSLNDTNSLAGVSLPEGEHTIDWMITDANGNADSCTSTITIDARLDLDEEVATQQIQIYPNPSNGRITLDSPSLSSLTVVGITGQVIMQRELSPGVNPIHMDNVPKGIYLFRIVENNNTHIERIIIE